MTLPITVLHIDPWFNLYIDTWFAQPVCFSSIIIVHIDIMHYLLLSYSVFQIHLNMLVDLLKSSRLL